MQLLVTWTVITHLLVPVMCANIICERAELKSQYLTRVVHFCTGIC